MDCVDDEHRKLARTTNRHNLTTRMVHSTSQLYPVNLATWDDGVWHAPVFSQSHPAELDDPWPYRFQRGEIVWICVSDGTWHQGRVVCHAKGGMTRKLNIPGLYFLVDFRIGWCRVRKWLAPLNGDIKPNTEHTLQLFTEASYDE